MRGIDSLEAAFANLAESGSGRRESWTMTAIPPNGDELRKLLPVGNLSRGR